MITDPHDPRPFRKYVRFADDGSVASVHEFEAGASAMPHAVEVTDMGRHDFSAMKIHPDFVAKLHAAADVVLASGGSDALTKALGDHAVADANVKAALVAVIAIQKEAADAAAAEAVLVADEAKAEAVKS